MEPLIKYMFSFSRKKVTIYQKKKREINVALSNVFLILAKKRREKRHCVLDITEKLRAA